MSEVTVQTGVVTPTEAPAAEATPAPDPRMAQLAKRERMIRQQDRDFKQKVADFERREAEFQAKQQFEQTHVSIDELKKSPYQTLSKHGVPYDQITQEALINAQSSDPIAAELARQKQVTEALEAKLQTIEKTAEENHTQSYQQALNQISREVKQMVDGDEKFEAIKATGSYQDVVKFIEVYFKKTNEIIDYEEAAEIIENDLIDDSVKRAQLKKVQAKLSPTQAAAQAELKPQGALNVKRRPTNSISVTPRDHSKPIATTLSNQIPSTTKPMTARERAIAAGLGQLK